MDWADFKFFIKQSYLIDRFSVPLQKLNPFSGVLILLHNSVYQDTSSWKDLGWFIDKNFTNIG